MRVQNTTYINDATLNFVRRLKDRVSKVPKEMCVQAIIDQKRREEIIKLIHKGADSEESSSLSGHRGINATQDLISDRFYWPALLRVSDPT